jgi:hypothetical protein
MGARTLVFKVQFRRAQIGLILVQRGAGRARRRDGIVDVLLADGLVLGQCAVTVRLGLRAGQRGLGAFDLGHDLVAGRAIAARVDQVERLARLHVAAFLEQPFADDAVDLGSHIRGGRRGDAPGQFRGQRGLGRLQVDIADFDRPGGGGGAPWPAPSMAIRGSRARGRAGRRPKTAER